jgi:plastocyanin
MSSTRARAGAAACVAAACLGVSVAPGADAQPAAPPVAPATTLPAVATPAPTPAPTGTLRVTVSITDPRGGSQPAADAVVWLPGVRAVGVPVDRAAARVAQRAKTFEPHVEVVRAGGEVAFPNYDRIYHNVFSLSEIAPFDLGLYRNGASRSLAFPRPGVVRIYCNIHPDMAAFLVVVDSDYFGKTGPHGTLELRDVPAGAWTVAAWHEKGGDGEGRVTVAPGRTARAALQLDASRWRPEKHKNKYGRDYPPPDDDENRY